MLKHNLPRLERNLPRPPLRIVEVALIFAIFFVQGAWPVPDVNEAHYLGKATHYWNPGWGAGDFFLETADTHTVFCVAFGWLSLLLGPAVLAWFGRVLTWLLLAWSWQRLSVAVVPRRWFSVLGAGLFACLVERCHMAGEWVIGGVEAKGFAYALVFLGLEALVRDRWNRAWLLFGLAAMFHVLVGGWAAVAAGLAWLWLGRQRPTLRSMAPGLVGGLLLSLPALAPSLMLDRGTDAEVVRQAHEIYVYKRLAHHLVIAKFPQPFILRFQLLAVVFGALSLMIGDRAGEERLVAWATGSLAIAVVGVFLGLLGEIDPVLAAGWLRYYWFRLADAAVPIAVALLFASLVARLREARMPLGPWLGASAALVIAMHVASYGWQRSWDGQPRGDKSVRHPEWGMACEWIAHSGRVPPQARFLTPKESQTFKWRTGRGEVVTRKDIPQDAASIVEWWRRLQEIHGTGSDDPRNQWHASLTELGAERLRRLGARYGADYLLTEAEPRLPLEVLYANRVYAVYRLSAEEGR